MSNEGKTLDRAIISLWEKKLIGMPYEMKLSILKTMKIEGNDKIVRVIEQSIKDDKEREGGNN
jgi:hypothetical protein